MEKKKKKTRILTYGVLNGWRAVAYRTTWFPAQFFYTEPSEVERLILTKIGFCESGTRKCRWSLWTSSNENLCELY